MHLSARRISTSSSRPGREFSVSLDISTPLRLSFEDAASAVNPPPVAWGPTSASARRRRRRNERRVFISVRRRGPKCRACARRGCHDARPSAIEGCRRTFDRSSWEIFVPPGRMFQHSVGLRLRGRVAASATARHAATMATIFASPATFDARMICSRARVRRAHRAPSTDAPVPGASRPRFPFARAPPPPPPPTPTPTRATLDPRGISRGSPRASRASLARRARPRRRRRPRRARRLHRGSRRRLPRSLDERRRRVHRSRPRPRVRGFHVRRARLRARPHRVRPSPSHHPARGGGPRPRGDGHHATGGGGLRRRRRSRVSRSVAPRHRRLRTRARRRPQRRARHTQSRGCETAPRVFTQARPARSHVPAGLVPGHLEDALAERYAPASPPCGSSRTWARRTRNDGRR